MEEPLGEVQIRRARCDEAEEIWRVTRLAYAPYRGKIRPTFQALKVRPSQIRNEIRTGKRVYGVAVYQNRIVATIRYRRRAKYLGLARLAVHPDFQRRGLGKRMLAWAEQEALRLGVRELRGDVRTCLPHLLEYYKRLGFRPFTRRSKPGYKGYLIGVKKRLTESAEKIPPPG